MPWSEVTVVNQRTRFVADVERGVFSMTEVCQRYGISRPTGYRWRERYDDEGPKGLYDRSHRPHTCPHQTPAAVWTAIRDARLHHPSWGPKKLLWLVAKRYEGPLPAPSTVAAWLKREGLVKPRRRSVTRPHPGRPLAQATAPNAIWTIDFKGQFRTQDGHYCYPLTIVDAYSRYLLGCQALRHPTRRLTRPVLERLFGEHGLPERIRSDNGPPFASTALARLSQLAVWWIKLGIVPELIEPGHPEQNPRHERLHRTLKAETTRPPASSCRSQQTRFTRWRQHYNEERPHEALRQRPPAMVYRPSPRPLPERLGQPEYPGHFEVRLVSRNGGIRWQKHRVPVSHTLMEEYIGFEAVDDGLWDVYFYQCRLGRFDERLKRIVDDRGRMFRHFFRHQCKASP
ncbi:MAG: IS481 family transposase [Gemmatimonadota bacterium]|nr:IS481 family transposase [Gemmatimonadota bacterium]MDH5550672.1 IS481 family transposase [Gemmatimonadota bacterium]